MECNDSVVEEWVGQIVPAGLVGTAMIRGEKLWS